MPTTDSQSLDDGSARIPQLLDGRDHTPMPSRRGLCYHESATEYELVNRTPFTYLKLANSPLCSQIIYDDGAILARADQGLPSLIEGF